MLIKVFLMYLLSGFFIVLGSVIWKKGETTFISGYKQMFFPKDERRLAKRIGMLIILFGVEIVLCLSIYLLLGHFSASIFVALIIIDLVLFFVLMMLDQLEI